MKHPALFQELKRRKVFPVAVVYAATAFVLLQAAELTPDGGRVSKVATGPAHVEPTPSLLGMRTVLETGALVILGSGLGAGGLLGPATTSRVTTARALELDPFSARLHRDIALTLMPSLEVLVELRAGYSAWAAADPVMVAALGHEPRFRALVRRLDLPSP